MKANILVVSCMLATFATAALAQNAAGSLTADPVYAQKCAKCHGNDANGRTFAGPSLIKSKKSSDDVSLIINNGKGKMPRFAGVLTGQQIKALTQEIMAARQ